MMGLDLNTLNRGVVAIERIANALERLADAGDQLTSLEYPLRKARRPIETAPVKGEYLGEPQECRECGLPVLPHYAKGGLCESCRT